MFSEQLPKALCHRKISNDIDYLSFYCEMKILKQITDLTYTNMWKEITIRNHKSLVNNLSLFLLNPILYTTVSPVTIH